MPALALALIVLCTVAGDFFLKRASERPSALTSLEFGLGALLYQALSGHRPYEGLSGADVVWKIVAVNASDIGAMGARPSWMLLDLATPADDPWLAGFGAGLAEACAAFGVDLIGGDTTGSTGPRFVAVTLAGAAPGPLLLRSGARPGDRILVTGVPGLAAAGYAVIISARRRGALEAVQERIAASGGVAHVEPCDAGDEDERGGEARGERSGPGVEDVLQPAVAHVGGVAQDQVSVVVHHHDPDQRDRSDDVGPGQSATGAGRGRLTRLSMKFLTAMSMPRPMNAPGGRIASRIPG